MSRTAKPNHGPEDRAFEREPPAADTHTRSRNVWPFYPLILAAFPVATLYSLNVAMVPLEDVWRPLGLALGAGILAWIIASAIFRSVPKGGFVTAVLFGLFWSFGPVSSWIGYGWTEVFAAVLAVATVIWAARRRTPMNSVTSAFNFGSCVLLVSPAVHLLSIRAGRPAQTFLHAALPVAASIPPEASRPDIFFIIVDGYGRTDQLQRVMGYSNQGFIDQLRARGFYVENRSHSNYVQTQLSLTGTLNLSFLQDYPDVFPRDSIDRNALVAGVDRSFIASYLKRLGYVYVGVTSGFNEVHFRSADLRYDEPLTLTMLEDALVQLTPVTEVDEPIKSLFIDRRKSLLGAFQNLKDLSTPTASPRFVAAHILAPHPPFVFGPDGALVRQHIPFGFWDGSHYMSVGGSPKLYRDGYVGQVQFLNEQLLPIIDQLIKAEGRRKPVIIIEGDHGSKLGLQQDDLEKTDLPEAFSNLMAFYVPDSVRAKLYPEMTSVNTFRVVLDGLFGEKLPLLPDRSFYSPFSYPYRFTDVTARLATPAH